MPSKPPLGSTVTFATTAGSNRDPCVCQGGFVALPPVARRRNFVGFDDEADAAVAKRDQVLDEPPRTPHAVTEDDIGFDSGNGAIDQHERDTELAESPQVRLSTDR